MIVLPFMIQEELITSSFCKILGWSIQYSEYLQSSFWVTSWLTLQYLPTLTRKNLCVPATSTQAAAAAEKRRLCLSGESVNMQQFLKGSLEL